ncbi:hypothetical protein [Lipingzhangella rawalii]|nr:hypothetical protein [Lipingzhangella rawalii]
MRITTFATQAATVVASGLLLVATASPAAGESGPSVAPESSTSASMSSLAECSEHYANTAYWADCEGGSQTSQARVAGLCEQIWGGHKWRYSHWYTIPAGASETIGAGYDCNIAVHDAKVEVR